MNSRNPSSEVLPQNSSLNNLHAPGAASSERMSRLPTSYPSSSQVLDCKAKTQQWEIRAPNGSPHITVYIGMIKTPQQDMPPAVAVFKSIHQTQRSCSRALILSRLVHTLFFLSHKTPQNPSCSPDVLIWPLQGLAQQTSAGNPNFRSKDGGDKRPEAPDGDGCHDSRPVPLHGAALFLQGEIRKEAAALDDWVPLFSWVRRHPEGHRAALSSGLLTDLLRF